MKIEWMCFSTARLLRNSSVAIAWLLLPCAISARSSQFAARQLGQRRVLAGGARRDQRLDHLRVHDRATGRDLVDRGDQMLAVAQAILEQVRAPVGAAVEQREAVARVGVLAHHDHADLRMGLAQPVGEHDALRVARRRHADVGHDDVGQLGLDRLGKLTPVLAGRDQIDARVGVEQVPQTLTDRGSCRRR